MLSSLLLILTIVVHEGLSYPAAADAKNKKYVTLEEMVPLNSRFAQRGFGGTWLSDTEIMFSKSGQTDVYKYDITTEQESVFINKTTLDMLNTTDITVSPDKLFLLARSDRQIGFRYSITARFALYNIAENKTYLIANHTRLQFCSFGGKGHRIGYVLDNDAYFLSEPSADNFQETRLTFDGVPGLIYNGVPDWVYEEEVFGSGSAMWFSDDGQRLAIASFNDTLVDMVFYTTYGKPGSVEDQYTTVEELKYPKVGTPNPHVSLRVINLAVTPPVNWITLKPPAVGESDDDVILGTVTWASATRVAALWLNRRQNKSVLVLCDADSGTCVDQVTRSEPDGWIEVTTPTFGDDELLDVEFTAQGANNSNEWSHIVSRTLSTGRRLPLTTGTRTVSGIVGWNKENGRIYYLSTLVDAPWQRHLWVAGSKAACISCSITLHDGKPCRYASSIASPNAKAYIINCQGAAPSNTWIYRSDDDTPIKLWEDNAQLNTVLEEYWLPQQVNLRAAVPGGFDAAIKLFLPPDLDFIQGSDKKYPMIVNIYTGPNSARVTDTFGLGYQTYVSTNRSIIYAYVEGRGSGLKGKDMLFSVNNRLGTFEVEDVINVTRLLTQTYSWIDETNIGLWGWSYGGYATSMALTKDFSHVFKCGIAVAPVTSWLYYDSIYTERFMGTPQDNPQGYSESDVTKRAALLKDRNFLLIHGNADDNVHYQNAMALARALQELDIAFEQMSYPDEAHALSGVSRHVYHTIDHFWTRCFEALPNSTFI